jgi:hypothetical protein
VPAGGRALTDRSAPRPDGTSRPPTDPASGQALEREVRHAGAIMKAGSTIGASGSPWAAGRHPAFR